MAAVALSGFRGLAAACKGVGRDAATGLLKGSCARGVSVPCGFFASSLGVRWVLAGYLLGACWVPAGCLLSACWVLLSLSPVGLHVRRWRVDSNLGKRPALPHQPKLFLEKWLRWLFRGFAGLRLRAKASAATMQQVC